MRGVLSLAPKIDAAQTQPADSSSAKVEYGQRDDDAAEGEPDSVGHAQEVACKEGNHGDH